MKTTPSILVRAGALVSTGGALILLSGCAGRSSAPDTPREVVLATREAWEASSPTCPTPWSYAYPQKVAEGWTETCLTGDEQSGIALSPPPYPPGSPQSTGQGTLAVTVNPFPFTLTNTGSTASVAIPAGMVTISDGTSTWTAKEVHFHTPFEHAVTSSNLDTYPQLEMHVKTQNAAKQWAVFAVVLEGSEKTASNVALKPIWDNLTSVATCGATQPVQTQLDLSTLLQPFTYQPYYSYPGSLTIPPCDEDISWFVLATAQPASMQQGTAFKNFLPATMQGPGYDSRITQDAGSRPVVYNSY